MKKTIFITFAMMVAAPVFAQESLPNPMTLKDCMEYAISNSTKVRIQQASNGDARLARRDAIFDAFTPEISGSSSAYYNFGRAVDPKTNTYVTTTSFHNSYGVSAGIALFNGFKAVNNMKISKTSIALGNRLSISAFSSFIFLGPKVTSITTVSAKS